MVWAASATFSVGEFHIGVRCDDAAFGRALFGALRSQLVEGVDAPPNYSVKVAAKSMRGRAAGFHLLYRSSALVLRTRDARRLFDGVCSYLASHGPYEPSLLVLAGVTLVGARGAVVAPSGLRQLLAYVERRLNLRGVRVVDAPWVLLEPATGEIVVPEHGLAVDTAAVEGLTARGRPDPAVPPGRYPVVGWALSGDGPVSRAQAVAQAMRTVVDQRDVQEILDGLARVMARVRPVRVPWGEPAVLAAALAELAES